VTLVDTAWSTFARSAIVNKSTSMFGHSLRMHSTDVGVLLQPVKTVVALGGVAVRVERYADWPIFPFSPAFSHIDRFAILNTPLSHSSLKTCKPYLRIAIYFLQSHHPLSKLQVFLFQGRLYLHTILRYLETTEPYDYSQVHPNFSLVSAPQLPATNTETYTQPDPPN
jgi:hypothetical protein